MSRWSKLRETIKTKADTKFEKKVGIFKADFKIPLWKPENGDHEIDIIPYKIGENDPRIGKGYEVGDDHYTLEIFVHSKIGPAGDMMVACLAQTYGKKCPICEYYLSLQKNGEKWENYKQYMPSKYPRSLYNVKVYSNSAEEAKGVQVWHTSAYLFEIHLAKLAAGSARNKGNYVYFADPEEGKSIAFTKEGQAESTKFMGIRFLERDYKIEESTIKKTHCLDSFINIPTYEEVYQLFYGEPCADSARAQEESVQETEKEPMPIKSADKRKVSKTTKKEPIETEAPIDVDMMTRKELIAFIEEEKIETDEDPRDCETEEIRALLKKVIEVPTTISPQPPVIAETKIEMPPQEDIKPKKLRSVPVSNKCPEGLVFGKDCDTTPGCEKCDSDFWKACTTENKKIRDAARNVTAEVSKEDPKIDPKPSTPPQPSTGTTRLRRRG